MNFRLLSAFSLFLLVLTALLCLQTAHAQNITPLSGWKLESETNPYATAKSTAITASAPVSGLPNLRVSATSYCIWDNGEYMFFISLEGAAFDPDKGTNIGSTTDMAGDTQVYGRSYNRINYQGRLDNGAPFGDVFDASDGNDNADHRFGVPIQSSSLINGSRLMLGSTSAGRPINVTINLKEPLMANAIQTCETYEQAAKAKKKAEEDREAAEEKAKEDEVKRQEQAQIDQAAQQAREAAAKRRAGQLAYVQQLQSELTFGLSATDTIADWGRQWGVGDLVPKIDAALAKCLAAAQTINWNGALLGQLKNPDFTTDDIIGNFWMSTFSTGGANIAGYFHGCPANSLSTRTFSGTFSNASGRANMLLSSVGNTVSVQFLPIPFTLQPDGLAPMIEIDPSPIDNASGTAPNPSAFFPIDLNGKGKASKGVSSTAPGEPAFYETGVRVVLEVDNAQTREGTQVAAILVSAPPSSTSAASTPDATTAGTSLSALVGPSTSGIWIDTRTHLTWTTQDNGSDLNWKQAAEYCSQLQTGGFSDWQLPTIEVLRGLYDVTSTQITAPTAQTRRYNDRGHITTLAAGSTWKVHVGQQFHLTASEFWSASQERDHNDSLGDAMSYIDGSIDPLTPNFNMAMRALCVRFAGTQ